MRSRNFFAAVGLAIVAHAPLGAQGIGGKWSVIWDADIRMDHDTAIAKARKPATLELTQRGDSVFGTWSGGIEPGIPLKGTFDGRAIQMSSGVMERTGMRDGQPMKMRVRWDVRGALSGSALTGTLFIYL